MASVLHEVFFFFQMLQESQLIFNSYARFLDRLVSSIEEKKHHEVKLKESLKDVAAKRMELQNSLSSSWPKQVNHFICHVLKFKNTYEL